MANEEIIFDEKSGISIEEQKEILSAINGIAEKNRMRLSQKTFQENGNKEQIAAKKSGAFFPLAVNISAAVVLAAGALFLVSFNGKMDAQFRAGNAVYNLTEKALIEEIRKDTAEKLAAKELEIASIISRLQEVDSQLALFYSNNQNLTSEQLDTQRRLLAMQYLYRDELSTLENERSQILENSRSREASLRAQLDERAREYSAAQMITSAELDSAMIELEKLANDRDRLAAMNAQLEAWYLLYAVNESGSQQNDQPAETARLEQTIADMQKTIDDLSSGSSGQASRTAELNETISTLRAQVSSLETEKTDLTRTNQSQEQDIANLRNQIEVIRQALLDN